MGLRHVAGQSEQQRHRVLGGRDDVGLRRVRDDDAHPGGGVDVDVVDPDAGAGDDLQAARLGEHVGIDLGGRADEDAVVVADALLEVVRGPVVAEVDVEPGRAQQVDAGVADVLLDEHLHDAAPAVTSASFGDDPVDAGREGLDVRRLDGREHADAQLVAAELAVRLGVDDAVGAQRPGDRRGVDVVGEVDRADHE